MLGGCATEGALTTPFSLSRPGPLASGCAASIVADTAGHAWWRAMNSPELNVLIECAIGANRDVRVAASRIAQARAALDGTRADLYPTIDVAAAGRRGRDSGLDPKIKVLRAGFQASWEPDLFGAKNLANVAANSDAENAVFSYQATHIAIAAEVATAYLETQGLMRRETVAAAAIANLARQRDVAHRRLAAGDVNRIDIDRLEAELEQERAVAIQLRGARQVRFRQLELLLGGATPPGGIVVTETAWFQDDVARQTAPADLLERRPDVRRQARQVDAAVARLGIAKRDLYPHIQFDWSGARERLSAKDLSAATTVVVGYGMSLSLPVFDGGRIRANIAVHEARAQEAMLEYEKAMLAAMADASIALTQFSAASAALPSLEAAGAANATAVQHAQRMFQAGRIDAGTLLETQRSNLRMQDALIQGQIAKWVAAVGVRRAFAGGV